MPVLVATLDDADALAVLINGAYRGANARAGWSHEADLLDGQRTDAGALRDMMANGVTILVRRSTPDDSPVGCVSLEPAAEAGVWYLGMLTIDPATQAAGVGRALLREAEAYAGGAGARAVTMTVIHLRAELIAWYERRGYERTGRTAPFPYGDERFGRPRRAVAIKRHRAANSEIYGERACPLRKLA